jgi:hypothetical protein
MELHMFSPWASPEIEELLVVTADFHRTGATLDVGHSVNFGRPWLRGSRCQHGLISLPYLYGSSLENLRIGPRLVKCYWLIPITSDEVNYKQQNGLEALEQTFEQKCLNIWIRTGKARSSDSPTSACRSPPYGPDIATIRR